MTFPTSHPSDGVYHCNQRVTFAFALWFDFWYTLNDEIIVWNVRSDRFPNDIPLFSFDCDGFCLHMCAVDTELGAPKFGHWSASERFVNARGAYWEKHRGRVLVAAASCFEISFLQWDDEDRFCPWLSLALEEDALFLGGKVFHRWRRICNVPQLTTNDAYARHSLPTEFWNVSKDSQRHWRQWAPSERCGLDPLIYLILYKYVGVYLSMDFSKEFLSVLSPTK